MIGLHDSKFILTEGMWHIFKEMTYSPVVGEYLNLIPYIPSQREIWTSTEVAQLLVKVELFWPSIGYAVS